MTGPLEVVEFNGKYTDLYMDIPTDQKYLIEADITYGKFDFPEEKIQKDYYVIKGDKLDLKGKVKGSATDSPKILIVSYDGKILIR